MDKFAKKLAITSILIGIIVLLVAFAGRWMIGSSPIFQQAKLDVQRQYGHSPSTLRMPLLTKFSFSEGQVSGKAEFCLCAEGGDCYRIRADKSNGIWAIAVTAME